MIYIEHKKNLHLLGDLNHGDTFFYLKSCSSLDLIQYILKLTGTCQFLATSYSISKRAITALSTLRNKGKMKSISICVDSNLKFSSPSACILAQKLTYKFTFKRIHAKVWLFDGTKKAVVISSMNLSHNPREESGIISFDESTFNFYKNILDEIFK